MHTDLVVFAGLWGTWKSLPLWMQAGGLVLRALIAAKAIDVVSVTVLRRVVKSTETDLDELLLDHLHLPVVVTIALAGVVVASSLFPPVLKDVVDPYVGKPTLTLLIVVWVWTLNRLANELLVKARETDSAYATFAPVFSNLLTFAFVVGGLFTVLSVWNVDVTPLLASAGIAGVAVGFAAKDTVANFFGGLALYFDRTYRVGDYIELGTGEAGTVVKVGIRSTTIMTRDEVTVTVPNSVLNNARIINQSAPKRRKRMGVSVGVAYGTDLDEFEELLLAIAEETDLVLDSPRPRVRFREFGDDALEYQIKCWIPAPVREGKARHELNRAIYERLREAGIEIPFPQRDVTVTEESTAEVATPADPPETDD